MFELLLFSFYPDFLPFLVIKRDRKRTTYIPPHLIGSVPKAGEDLGEVLGGAAEVERVVGLVFNIYKSRARLGKREARRPDRVHLGFEVRCHAWGRRTQLALRES